MIQSVTGNLLAPTGLQKAVRGGDWITSEDVLIINHEWKAGRSRTNCCATTYISGCRSGRTNLRMEHVQPELNLLLAIFS
jgi:hypothetical protein